MIVLGMLLVGAFMLLVAGVVVAVVACCQPRRRPAAPLAPLGQQGWALSGYEQNLNRSWPGQDVYGVPAAVAVWPGMWVGPAIPAEVGDPPVVQVEPPLCRGVPQQHQRRQLSDPARRVIEHGTNR
jgi:hypothetical protein